jgi:hypothetical protein
MTRLPVLLLLTATTAAAVVPKFFFLGFTHILPHGPDHILFILALFFLSRGFGVLLFQMTLFTLAHSLTLGLSLHGLVGAPSSLVEVAIALGFAHSFRGMQPDRTDFLPALFSFNMGIEIGQLAVLGIAWIAVAAWTRRGKCFREIARPASAAIALTGFCWAVVRAV